MANYTKATNFASKDSLLTGNPSKLIRGSEIDAEFNSIATAVATKADTNSPTFTGTPLAPTASAGTNTQQLATTAFVTSALNTALPSGVILIWSGASSAIPAGWYLCNGTNGTPDLRDRFVVGAGSTYVVGNTGGSKDAVLVSHTHTATVTDPGHTHSINNSTNVLRATSGSNGSNSGTNWRNDTISNNSATTGITVSNSTEGVSGTNANLPPYYALCYIMKA